MTNENIELGELTLQYVATSDEALEELGELRSTITEELGDLDELQAVAEDEAFEDFDARIGWGGDSE